MASRRLSTVGVGRADAQAAATAGRHHRRGAGGRRRRSRRDERPADRGCSVRCGLGERLRGLGDGLRPARPQPGDDDRDARRRRVASTASTDLPVVVDCDNGYGGLTATSSGPWWSSSGPGSPPSASRTTCSRSATASTRASREARAGAVGSRRAGCGREGGAGVRGLRAHRPRRGLIAGHGVEAACERAGAYADAGADAILIHSQGQEPRRDRGVPRRLARGRARRSARRGPHALPGLLGQGAARQGVRPGHPRQPADARVGEGDGGDAATLAIDGRAADGRSSHRSVDHIFDLVHTRETIEAEDEGGTDGNS